MRLRSLSVRGVRSRYVGAEPLTLDLEAMPGALIAFAGRKGCGKTTLAECVPASLFKRFPTRPDWYDCFDGRDAFVATTWSDDAGRSIEVRVLVDAERRTTESYITVDGEAVVNGKDAPFRAWIQEHFGSERSFLASVFACQKKTGSLIRMTKGERKATLGEWIGTERYEALSAQARDRATAADSGLATLRRQVLLAQEELKAIPAAEDALRLSEDAALLVAGSIDAAREEEAEASRKLGLARSAADRIAPLEAAVSAAAREVETTADALEAAVALKGEADRARDGKIRFIDARKVEELEEKAAKRHRDTVAGIEARRQTLDATIALREAVKAAAEEMETLASGRTEIDARGKRRAELEAKVREAKVRLDGAEKALIRAQDEHARKIADLKRRAGLLPSVPCTAAESWAPNDELGVVNGVGDERNLAGTCPLLADARKAKEVLDDIEAAPFAVDELVERNRLHGEYEAADLDRRTLIPDAITDASRLRLIEARERELKPIAAKASAVAQAMEHLAGIDAEIDRAEKTLDREIEEARKAVAEAEEARLLAVEEWQAALEQATEKIATATAAAATAKTRHAEAEAALLEARAQLGDAGVAAAESALQKATAARKTAEASLREADQAVASAKAKLDGLRAKEAAIEAEAAKMRGLETELGDWRFVEQALLGVRDLEIDAAGPEITAVANELLRAAAPEFSIAFETLREKKDGSGYMEVMDMIVFHDGIQQDIATVSGGEEALIDEAIRLACAVHCARKSGTAWKILIRDEPTGALDAESARLYPPMLRRVMEIGAFERVIFISHSKDAYEAADVLLHIEGGRILAGAERRAA